MHGTPCYGRTDGKGKCRQLGEPSHSLQMGNICAKKHYGHRDTIQRGTANFKKPAYGYGKDTA